MAKVTNQEIFDNALFQTEIDKAKKLVVALDQVEKGFIDVAKAQQQIINQEDNKTIQSVQKTKKAIKELTEVERAHIRVQKQKHDLGVQLRVVNSEANKQNVQTKLQIKEQTKAVKALELEKLKSLGLIKKTISEINKETKAVKDQVKAAQKQRKTTIDNANAFKVLSKRTNTAQARFKRLAAQYGETDKRAQRALITFRKLDNRLRSINQTARDGRRDVGRYGLAFNKLGATLKGGLGFLGVAGGVTLVASAFRDAGKTIIDFDERVADISKVTGLAKEDARLLAEELLKIDTRTSVNELLELAVAGGRLGLTGRELLEFTESTDRAFVALGDSLDGSAEDIGLSLGKIASTFGIEQEFGIAESINKIGSSLNVAGASSKANEGFIQDFTARLAGVAVQANLTIPQVQALGVIFDESGQSVEVAASTISKLLPAIGKDTEKFAKVAGLNIKEFEKLVSEKPLEALKAVAKGAKSSEKGLIGLSKTLQNYGITSARAAGIVGILSDKTERLTEVEALLNQAFEDGTSIADEFALKNETLGATIERLGNRWDKLILKVDSGAGVFGKAFVGIVNAMNKVLENLERFEKGITILTSSATVFGDRWKVVLNGFLELFENTVLFPLIGALELIDKIAGTDLAKNIKLPRFDLVHTEVEALTVQFKKLSQEQIRNKDVAQKIITAYHQTGITIEQAQVQYVKLLETVKKVNDETNEGTDDLEANGKAVKVLTGLIELQEAAVGRLNERILRATSEDQILKLSLELDVEKEELTRLKRIVTSTLEEINKIELNLIDDQTDKIIAKEEEKSRKIIEKIISNSRIQSDKKLELIEKEENRLDAFITNAEIRRLNKGIDNAAKLAKAEFEVTKTGFKTKEAFEKERSAQFEAIERNRLQARLDLLKVFGREEDKLEMAQLEAKIEGLNKFADESKKLGELIGNVVQVVGEEIDKAFNKRIEKLGESIEKTGETVDRLREKAAAGQLDAEESIAFEQKKEAELEQQRARERKNQERTQAFFAVLSSFQANDGNLAKTVTDIGVLRALAGGLSAFDGVDDTGGRGNIDSKGGRLWTLHPNEQVYSKEDRKDLGFRSREEVKDIVRMYDSGTLNDLMVHDASNQFLNPSSFVLNGMSTKKMEAKMDTLNRSIQNIKIPEGTLAYDGVREILEFKTRTGNTKKIIKSKLRGR